MPASRLRHATVTPTGRRIVAEVGERILDPARPMNVPIERAVR